MLAHADAPRVYAAGVVAPLLQAMRAHPEAKVQASACELLQTLLVAERSGTLDAAEAGEPEACRRELGAKLDLTPS